MLAKVTPAILLWMIWLFSGCASTPFHPYDEWKTEDKILFGANVGLNVVDVIQTSRCERITGCIEVNPLLVRADNKPDMLRVVGFKALLLAGQYYVLGHKDVDSTSKTIALGVGTTMLTALVVSNAFQLKRSGYSGIAMFLPILSW